MLRGDLVADVRYLASDATDLWTTEILTTTNRIWVYPAAPNFLTYKLAHSFVFAIMDVLVPWLSFMRAEGNTSQSQISHLTPTVHRLLSDRLLSWKNPF